MATDARPKTSRKRPRQEPEIPPLEAAGKWIAWSLDGMRILAIGDTIEEVEQKAHEAGEPEPMFQVGPYPHRM